MQLALAALHFRAAFGFLVFLTHFLARHAQFLRVRPELVGRVDLFTQLAESRRGFAVGGITLVGIHLDDRAAVDAWAVLLVMLIVVIGVQGVGVVRRDQQRLADGEFALLRIGNQALDNILQKRPLGTTSRLAAHFFMISAYQHGRLLGVSLYQRA